MNTSVHVYHPQSQAVVHQTQYYCQIECGLPDINDPTEPSAVFNRILLVYLLPVVGFVGLIGNSLAFWTFTRPVMLNSTNSYLAALAASDMVLVLTSMFMFTLESLRHETPSIQWIYLKLIAIIYPLGCIAHTCSVYYCIAADADCFVRECFPWLKRYLVSTRIAKINIISVISFAMVYNAPHWLEIIIARCLDLPTNQTRVEVCASPMRMSVRYHEVYYVYCYTVLMALGPLMVLVLLTVAILCCLCAKKRRRVKRHARLGTGLRAIHGSYQNPERIVMDCGVIKNGLLSSKKELKNQSDDGPAALIMVVLLFIGCNTLSLIVNFLETFAQLGSTMDYLVDGSNLLVVLNSSINIFIYISFDSKFRMILQSKFCRQFSEARKRLLTCATRRPQLRPKRCRLGSIHSREGNVEGEIET